nr:MAG TPA: hypothetical protein [Caudoviricetes sp.]
MIKPARCWFYFIPIGHILCIDKTTHIVTIIITQKHVIEAGSPRSSCRRHTKHRMR